MSYEDDSTFPQGLEPATFAESVFGTAEAVPFQTVEACRVPSIPEARSRIF